MSSVSERMAAVYVTGPMAGVIEMGGAPGFMNLGFAPVGRTAPLPERQRRLVRMVHELLGLRAGLRVLDIGCGKGGALGELVTSEPGVDGTGLNIDPAQVDSASRHLAQICSGRMPALVCGDALRLPFNDANFDAVYAIELGSHVAAKEVLAREIRRVLRDRGRAVLSFMTLNRPFAEFGSEEQDYLQRVAAYFDEDPAAFGTLQDYLKCFASCGLRVHTRLDLTDGVFHHRYVEQVELLNSLLSGRQLEGDSGHAPDSAFLQRFLSVNIEQHPCRYYEYHLVCWAIPDGLS